MSLNSLAAVSYGIKDNMPKKTISTASNSFFASSVSVIALTGGNVAAGILVGTFAASISLIDSIATSVFKTVFQHKNTLSWYEDYAKRVVSITAANFLMGAIVGMSIPSISSFIIASLVISSAVDLVRGTLFREKPIDLANFYLLV